MDSIHKQTWGIFFGSSLTSCACSTPNCVISDISVPSFWRFSTDSNPGTSVLFWFYCFSVPVFLLGRFAWPGVHAEWLLKIPRMPVLFFSLFLFHWTRGDCRYRSTGMWGNWITAPVILEWLFQMGVLLTLALFPYLEENYLFCGESQQMPDVERCFTLEMILTHRSGGTWLQLVSFLSEFSGLTPYLQFLKPRPACENSSCCFPSL